jgi:hypothetical protein
MWERRRGDIQRPIIILTYAQSGSEVLRTWLGRYSQLACLVDTGLVPLGRRAIEASGQIERSPQGRPSALALTAIRSMITAMVAPVLAREGKSRWCDISPGSAPAASAFLELYPEAQFIGLHRNCLDTIASVMSSSQWGVLDNGFRMFAAAHPGNPVAALANYWMFHEKAILECQQKFSGQYISVRYEDLMAEPERVRSEMLSFIDNGWRQAGIDPTPEPSESLRSPRRQAMIGCVSDGRTGESSGETVPAHLIPRQMLADINEVLRSLGYPVISPDRQLGRPST